jgi:hypothetical protein
MYTLVQYDVGGGLVAGGTVLVILTVIISLVESYVLVSAKWNRYGRCLTAALLMNAVTALVGAALIVRQGPFGLAIALPVSFVLSVIIEAGILMLLKRGAVRQNWVVSLKANAASYLVVILPCLIWPGIINFIAHIFLPLFFGGPAVRY